MPDLVPVDHDPFAVNLTPVDHQPDFAAASDQLVAPPANPATPPEWWNQGVRNVVGGMANQVATLPARVAGASEQLRTTGDYDPSAPVEAAQLMMGGGAPFAVRGALGAAGGRLAQTAEQAVEAGASGAGSGLGIRAYHGSPHDFDAFDLSKIGTGEGAQAYGHGLYFAENEATAKGYRDQLARDMYYSPKGDMFNPQSQLQHVNVRVEARNNGPDLDATITRAKDLLSRASEQTKPMLEHDIQVLQSFKDAGGVAKNPGRMYEANIKADPEHFLDWDKPLSEQSEHVKNAVRRLGVTEDHATGDDVHRDIVRRFLPPDNDISAIRAAVPNATRAMREAGIPGIRYLDAGSRTAGEGTSNYVVFNDKLIDIVKKYGLAALMAGPAAGGAVKTLTPVDYDPFAGQ